MKNDEVEGKCFALSDVETIGQTIKKHVAE